VERGVVLVSRFVQSAFHSFREVCGLAPPPIVEENVARFFVSHVVVDGQLVDAASPQRLQSALLSNVVNHQ
jgi:hypothetical protein